MQKNPFSMWAEIIHKLVTKCKSRWPAKQRIYRDTPAGYKNDYFGWSQLIKKQVLEEAQHLGSSLDQMEVLSLVVIRFSTMFCLCAFLSKSIRALFNASPCQGGWHFLAFPRPLQRMGGKLFGKRPGFESQVRSYCPSRWLYNTRRCLLVLSCTTQGRKKYFMTLFKEWCTHPIASLNSKRLEFQAINVFGLSKFVRIQQTQKLPSGGHHENSICLANKIKVLVKKHDWSKWVGKFEFADEYW